MDIFKNNQVSLKKKKEKITKYNYNSFEMGIGYKITVKLCLQSHKKPEI